MQPLRVPPPATRGSLVHVVAPSGPFDPALLEAGLRRLNHYRIHVPAGMAGRQSGFFAGSDDQRLAELQAALDSTEAQVVLVARGGYGLSRLIPALDWGGFGQRPKWLCGFSDATVLHQASSKAGWMSLHGPNATTLARATEEDLSALLDALEGRPSAPLSGLRCVRPGIARGTTVGGNLTVLFAEACAGRLQLPKDALLILEDVSETSYRIDRMLTALRQGGHLSAVTALMLGDFADCSPGKFEVETGAVLLDHARLLGVPAVAELPCGHGERQWPWRHGAPAQLDAGAGTLTFLT